MCHLNSGATRLCLRMGTMARLKSFVGVDLAAALLFVSAHASHIYRTQTVCMSPPSSRSRPLTFRCDAPPQGQDNDVHLAHFKASSGRKLDDMPWQDVLSKALLPTKGNFPDKVCVRSMIASICSTRILIDSLRKYQWISNVRIRECRLKTFKVIDGR
jgi:hypothetical protein